MSEPILELPGITVTRESIKLDGREVFLGTVKRVYVRKKYDRLPWKMRWFALIMGTAPFWYVALLWLSVTVFVRTSLFGFLLALCYPLIGVMTISFGLYIAWCRKWYRDRRDLRVQLKTTEGTFTAYSTRDKEQAEQVQQAIEEALGSLGKLKE